MALWVLDYIFRLANYPNDEEFEHKSENQKKKKKKVLCNLSFST